MKVLVTGASGFLGRAVVRACGAAGHEVLAMVRPASAGGASPEGAGAIVAGDLRQPGAWGQDIAGVDAVIHLAAAVGGDLPTQLANTVAATENLLAALPSGLRRFVHVSSFSVYDYRAIPFGGKVDEHSPIETRPTDRDAYTTAKLLQEAMVVDYCADREVPLMVVRPGAIYGPGKPWDFGSALKLGRFDLILAPLSSMRLTYVDNCADAIVAALGASDVGVVNVVDSQAPSHAAFHRLARRAGALTGFPIWVPWTLVAIGGLMIRAVNRLFLRGRARLPEILDYPRQAARWKPLRYPSGRARSVLGWAPKVPLADGIKRTVESLPPAAKREKLS